MMDFVVLKVNMGFVSVSSDARGRPFVAKVKSGAFLLLRDSHKTYYGTNSSMDPAKMPPCLWLFNSKISKCWGSIFN